MSNLIISTQIELPEDWKRDSLVECTMLLRALGRLYPEHLDIAYRALEQEANLPPKMVEMERA